MSNIKRFKVGAVQKKKDGNGTTVSLGSKSNNPKYKTTVQLIVRDGTGNVVADVTDPYLVVSDPRLDKDGNTSKFADKIPDFILKELSVVVSDYLPQKFVVNF